MHLTLGLITDITWYPLYTFDGVEVGGLIWPLSFTNIVMSREILYAPGMLRVFFRILKYYLFYYFGIFENIKSVLGIRTYWWHHFKLESTTLSSSMHEIFRILTLTTICGYTQTAIWFSSITWLEVVNLRVLQIFKLRSNKCLLLSLYSCYNWNRSQSSES